MLDTSPRQHASRYLARVEADEELAVTNNGRLVARLVLIAEPETPELRTWLTAQIDQGESAATASPGRT